MKGVALLCVAVLVLCALHEVRGDDPVPVRTCKNDCSHHGECIVTVCQCNPGWTGDDCSEPNLVEKLQVTLVAPDEHGEVDGDDEYVVENGGVKTPYDFANPGHVMGHGDKELDLFFFLTFADQSNDTDALIELRAAGGDGVEFKVNGHTRNDYTFTMEAHKASELKIGFPECPAEPATHQYAVTISFPHYEQQKVQFAWKRNCGVAQKAHFQAATSVPLEAVVPDANVVCHNGEVTANYAPGGAATAEVPRAKEKSSLYFYTTAALVQSVSVELSADGHTDIDQIVADAPLRTILLALENDKYREFPITYVPCEENKKFRITATVTFPELGGDTLQFGWVRNCERPLEPGETPAPKESADEPKGVNKTAVGFLVGSICAFVFVAAAVFITKRKMDDSLRERLPLLEEDA